MKYLHTIIIMLAALLWALPLRVLAAEQKPFTVVIDAGHGGKDYGAIGATSNEKSINLAVAKLLAKKIKDSGNDIKVVMTRSDDKFIALNDRAAIANAAKGDLFISIHVNSVDKRNPARKRICGAEIYVVGLHKSEENLAVAQRENSVITLEEDYTETYNGFDPNSIESYIAFELTQSVNIDHSLSFAAEAQNRLIHIAKRADRGVRQAGFWVLWATSMPAVLVELDFISNPESEKYLASAKGQETLATALYDAFLQYYAQVTGNTPAQPEKEKVQEVVNQEITQKSQPEKEAVQEVAKQDNKPQPGEVEYRIQILTSSTPIGDGDARFKGEKGAQCYFENGLYKYTLGSYSYEAEAISQLRWVRKKFSDAFVIKMKDGKRVPK